MGLIAPPWPTQLSPNPPFPEAPHRLWIRPWYSAPPTPSLGVWCDASAQVVLLNVSVVAWYILGPPHGLVASCGRNVSGTLLGEAHPERGNPPRSPGPPVYRFLVDATEISP